MENPEKIIWTNELTIGNPNIDNVHKELLEVYNDLIEYAKSGGKRAEFALILSKMTDYCLIHFKKEEEYMKKLSYPELTNHKNYHRDYIYKVAMFNIDLTGANPPDLNEIIEFLEKWWVYHILKVDLKYEHYKREIQSDVTY
jgi:hemerythrin